MLGAVVVVFWSHVVLQGSYGLRMLEIQVPPSIMRGQPIMLNCTFDLEGDILYSIKWYKNNVEFYRYIPSDQTPGQMYPLKGIYLDSKFPHGPSIYMHKTDLTSEGTYRCEVSAEAPYFQTVMDEKELRVYVLPDRGPTIIGARSRYSIGDTLNVTCMSGPSKPPSFLEWRVNDEEVEHNKITRMSPLRHPDGLQSSMLGLQLHVLPADLRNGVLSLKCIAFISKAYLTTKNEIVATNKPKIAENHATVSHDGPIITGGRLRYAEKNVVNVNCTSVKSHPPAELRWYINDKEASRDYLRVSNPIRFPDGEESTVLGLRFTVQPRHFQRGEMRLKCVATLFKVTNMRSEEMVISSRQESSGLTVVINRNGFNSVHTSSIKLWITVFIAIFLHYR